MDNTEVCCYFIYFCCLVYQVWRGWYFGAVSMVQSTPPTPSFSIFPQLYAGLGKSVGGKWKNIIYRALPKILGGGVNLVIL